MGFELDPFDDLFSDGAANNARPGGKFRPKAKLKPRKESSTSVQSTQSTQSVTNAENELTETLRTEKASENNTDDFAGVTLFDDKRSSGLINHSSEHLAARESMGPIVSLHSEPMMGDNDGDWNSCFGKSEGENGDIFSGLGILDGFLPQSTTITETPTVHVATSRNAEVGFGSAHFSLVDPTLRVCNTADSCSSPEVPVSRDSLTCEESAISNAVGDFHVKNGRLETEEVEAHPCLETLDTMPELTTTTDDAMPEPSKIDYLDEDSIPAIPPDDIIDFSSLEFDDSIPTDPTFDLPVNDEPANLIGTSHSDAAIPGEHPETVPEISSNIFQRGERTTEMLSELSVKHQQISTAGQAEEAGRTLRRSKRLHVHQLVDESEDEVLECGQSAAECRSGSVVNEDNHNDEEYQSENEPQQKRVGRKSKKTVPQNEKPVRKHKKADEVSDRSSKKPSKKFSHSTRKRGRFGNWIF